MVSQFKEVRVNIKDIADGFYDFFITVGPELAKNIVPPNKDVSIINTLKNVTVNAMFWPI